MSKVMLAREIAVSLDWSYLLFLSFFSSLSSLPPSLIYIYTSSNCPEIIEIISHSYRFFAINRSLSIPDGSIPMNEFDCFETKDIKVMPEMMINQRLITVGPRERQQYMCGECGKGYSWMANLRRHQRLECGKLPKHRCRLCRKEFYRRYELKNHYNTKHAVS